VYLTELMHRRPRTWIRDVEQLHHLLQTHGDAALGAAFERGLAKQAIGAEYIAHYLGTTTPSLSFDDRDRPSTRDFLTLLATEEIAHRQQTHLARLTRRPRFPFLKTIDDSISPTNRPCDCTCFSTSSTSAIGGTVQ
jgi:hypothetical protein